MNYEFVPCSLCGKYNYDVIIQGKKAGQIVQCRNDGLIWRNPRPKTDICRDFHNDHVNSENKNWFNRSRIEVLRREAEVIKNKIPCGNLLDVGCATGIFFDNFSLQKWNLYGVEPSKIGFDLASKHGANVFCGILAEAKYPQAYFDVVSMLDTIYYSTNPRADLEKISQILKKNGLLALEIPGWGHMQLRGKGFICWLRNKKWVWGFDDPWHLYYFTHTTLKIFLNLTGFRVIQMIPEQATKANKGIFGKMLVMFHFELVRLLFKLTAGKISISGKELYLAVKE